MCMLIANPFAFSPTEYALIAVIVGASTVAIVTYGAQVKAAFARVRADAGDLAPA